MEAQEDRMQLGNYSILIVARVAEECASPCVRSPGFRHVTREIARLWIGDAARERSPELEVTSVGLVQIRLIIRSAPIQIMEIEPWRSEVDQRVRVVLLHQRAGWIEGQVVI